MGHCALEQHGLIPTQHSHPALTVPHTVLLAPGSALLPQAFPLPPRDMLGWPRATPLIGQAPSDRHGQLHVKPIQNSHSFKQGAVTQTISGIKY